MQVRTAEGWVIAEVEGTFEDAYTVAMPAEYDGPEPDDFPNLDFEEPSRP